MSSKGSQQINLPLQLASLIHGEAGKFLAEEAAVSSADGINVVGTDDPSDSIVEDIESMAQANMPAQPPFTHHHHHHPQQPPNNNKRKKSQQQQAHPLQQNSLNEVISAAQNRHVKELGSYIRTVCMRMGFA